MQKTAIYRTVYGILAIANVAIFLSLWVQSGYRSPDSTQLLAWGANYAPLTLTGEPWRLLTSAFLHANWLHLLANLYMLVLLGAVLERIVGGWRFASIYVLSAMGGGLLSALWNGVHEISVVQGIAPTVSVGASGALMGLAGAALVLALHARREGSPHIGMSAIVQVIVINLAFGFTAHGVDNAAHVGGLITGFVAALVLWRGELPTTQLHRAGLPVLVTMVGGALFLGLAHLGGNQDLMDIKLGMMAAQSRDEASQAAAQEQKHIDRMAQEDARTQPAPVSADAAEGKTVSLGPYPTDITIGASGKQAYVTDLGDNSLRVIDLATLTVARTIRGPRIKHTESGCYDNDYYFRCLGRGAYGTAVSADEHTAYVASMAQDSVTRIDLDKGKVLDSVKVGRYPRKLMLSPAGDTLYVFNDSDDTISVVSVPQWPKVLTTLKLDDEPVDLPSLYKDGHAFRNLDMWLSTDGKRLFAMSFAKNVVSEFDTQNFHLIRDHSMGEKGDPDHTYYQAIPTPSMKGVWLHSSEGMAWADPQTLAIKKTYDICNDQLSVRATSRDGAWLVVADGGDTLNIVKAATRRSIRAYPQGYGAEVVAFSPDNKTLYKLDNGTPRPQGTLTAYDVSRFVAPGVESADKDFLCPASMPDHNVN